MALSKKDVDDLKPMIDRVVRSVMGFSEPTLITAAINCLDNGYDRKKTADKLSSIIDDRQASGFADQLFSVYDDYRSSSKVGKKRKDAKVEEIEPVGPKKKRFNEPLPPEPGQPSPGQLTADKIKEMMQNAQKAIKERKVQLGAVIPTEPEPQAPPMLMDSFAPDQPPPSLPQQQLMMNDAMEKAKRAAELQAKIQAQLASAGLGGIEVKMPPPVDKNQPQTQPTPLILDEQGRTIDINTGEAIQLTHYQPTLKANIRAKKREQFKAVIQDKAPEEISEAGFFDSRVSAKAPTRQKKSFRFFEQGKFEQLASRLRTKAQLDRLQGEIASAAKKTGIASATKLATLQPKVESDFEMIPSAEWWDAVILRNESYSSLKKDPPEGKSRFEGITHLIEHPAQMTPPAEPKAVQISVMLTKQERKKLRRQNRNEAQKEVTEKIRLGLIPPPEPKVRMANLMRVLGTEAVQDPTKVEAHVRAQMAKRVKAHEEANANRKLTKEQKSQKKIKKIKEDTSLGVHVSVYRVRDLSNPAHKFKVETNAKQLLMTGSVVLHRDCNVIVVEGGPKQQKKFRRLMLHRIKWNEDKHGKLREENSDSEDEESKGNSCVLVWEGTVKTRSFGDMKFKACPTPSFAKEQFKKHNTEHYWDLAFSGSVLEAAGEEL